MLVELVLAASFLNKINNRVYFMNIIERVIQAISEDDENMNKQSQYLVHSYANNKHKKDIDEVFICLCGCLLATLIGI